MNFSGLIKRALARNGPEPDLSEKNTIAVLDWFECGGQDLCPVVAYSRRQLDILMLAVVSKPANRLSRDIHFEYPTADVFVNEVFLKCGAANFPFRGLNSKLSTHLTIFLSPVFRTTTIRQENQTFEL